MFKRHVIVFILPQFNNTVCKKEKTVITTIRVRYGYTLRWLRCRLVFFMYTSQREALTLLEACRNCWLQSLLCVDS